jgi:signal transduction histidine kinase
MIELFRDLFSSDVFMPHGHCYLWQPGMLWLQVGANALIGLAYVAISLTIAYLVRKGQNVPFKGMALVFGVFIVSCGLTHFSEIYVTWYPAYWLDGALRVVTALASVTAAILLPPLVPQALALARGVRSAREHGVKLQAAIEDLGQLYEKTRELDQLKTHFFANLSHELRTPLTLILGPTEKLAAAENLSEAQRRDAELILRNARTLLKHVNDLLDVARLDAGKLQPRYAGTDLAHLVRLVAAHFDGLADERGMQYTIEAPAELHAEVDPAKIERVVLNLLANAFKFTPPSGRVRCTLAAAGKQAVIEVADSGPGVRPEHRELIFERFRQADGGSTRKHGGTGLGLAISRDFVALHGGTITVDAAPEGGALFRVVLPLHGPVPEAVPAAVPTAVPTAVPAAVPEVVPAAVPEAVIDDAVANASDAGGAGGATHLFLDDAARQAIDELRTHIQRGAPAAEGEKPLVLVVENNVEMNRFVCETLAPEHRTESAFDGKEGLDKAVALVPELIVSDVMMPEMSGEQLVAEIRRRHALDGVAILLLTAKADDALRVRLLRQGAQDYIMKPFSPDELRARAGNLVTVKRTRDVLQQALDTQTRDLEQLARDVAQRKRDLQTALESMRVAREHAEQASQLKTNFLSMVSHELRSPLATLQLQLERIQSRAGGVSAPEIDVLVQRMAGSTGRLQDLIEGLLQYARIQSGRLTTDIETFDVRGLAREVLEEVRMQAEDKGLTLVMECPAELPPLVSDPRLVRLILVNLLGNAIKFTEQGMIKLALAHDGGAHRLAVTDTGPGIPREHQTRIFEPFEQMEPARKKHLVGVGLGLALVREMVSSLHGTMALDSAIGAGSTFEVTLPPSGPAPAPERAGA